MSDMRPPFSVVSFVEAIADDVRRLQSAEEASREAVAALRQSPHLMEATTSWRVFRIFEYEIHVNGNARLRAQRVALEAIAELALAAAPEVVAEFPISNAEGMLLLRYRECPGERLIPGDAAPGPFQESARRRFREDMQKLANHGMVHPYLRGFVHWLVSSESGTLLMEHWSVARKADEHERNKMMERVDQLLASRSDARPIADVPAVAAEPARSRIEEVFGVPRVLLPVVHPTSERAAMASVRVARDCGCKGVFVINQGMSTDEVLRLVMTIRREHPSLWVGVNLLGHSAIDTLRRGLDACEGRLDGIWTDNAGIDEEASAQPAAQAFVDARGELGWHGLYFGGVAFKYQRPVEPERLPVAALAASPYMDVVCTSGPGTGQAAQSDKVVRMRRGMPGAAALALASGVTDENVAEYLPYVDAFLVGTGIERDFGVLDPDKVTRLHREISMWSSAKAS